MVLGVFQVFNKAFRSEMPALSLLTWFHRALQIDPSNVAEKKDTREQLRALSQVSVKAEELSAEEQESREYLRFFAKESQDYAVQREALRSIQKLGDEQAYDLVLGLLKDSDVIDVRVQAMETLLTLDPKFSREEGQELLLDLLKDETELHRSLSLLINELDPEELTWLTDVLAQDYSDSAKELGSTDLRLLAATRSVKANIADFSEQLVTIAADYNVNDEDRINAVRILAAYFPEKRQTELAALVPSLDGDPDEAKQVLLAAIRDYIGEKPYPVWDEGVLESGPLKLERDAVGLTSLCKIGGLELSYKDSKPDVLSFEELGLRIKYFYTDTGSVSATQISYGGKDYSFVPSGLMHSFSHLSDMPEIGVASNYPAMRFIGDSVPDRLFVYQQQADPVTIFDDGAMQLKMDDFTLQISSDGALQIHDKELPSCVTQFVTNCGEYRFVEDFDLSI